MPLDGLKDIISDLATFSVEEEVNKLLYENSEVIIGLLQLQLSLGKDGDNKDVTINGNPFYKLSTINEKLANGDGLGKVVTHVTNYMYGGFYDGMYIVITGTSFEVFSDVPYFEDILTRSGGEKIMKLSEVSLNILMQDYILPQLNQRLIESIS